MRKSFSLYDIGKGIVHFIYNTEKGKYQTYHGRFRRNYFQIAIFCDNFFNLDSQTLQKSYYLQPLIFRQFYFIANFLLLLIACVIIYA